MLVPRLVLTQPALAIPTWHRHGRGQMQFKPITMAGWSLMWCCYQVHPCGRYRHNTVVFILAKEYNLKNLRTIHRLDRLTSGLLMFGRNPRKAREMEQQIRNRQVLKEYVCRVEGEFPEWVEQLLIRHHSINTAVQGKDRMWPTCGGCQLQDWCM